MKPKLEQDEEGWSILPAMGNYSLETGKHIIKGLHQPRFTLSHLHMDGDITGVTLDPVQNVIARTQGLMCIGKRCPNHPRLSLGWKISLRVFQLLDPSTSPRKASSPLGVFDLHQRMGRIGLMFSSVTHR